MSATDTKVTKKDRKVLVAIAEAMKANAIFYVNPEHGAKLAKAGLVELHETEKNAKGDRASRLTEAGAKLAAEGVPATAPRAVPTVPEGGFAIVSNFKMPEPKPRGRASNIYPFEKLEIGQSFFVPATTDNPEPWKRMTSTVSSANKRYSETTPRRHFRIAEGELKGAKGAYIGRVEPPAKEAPKAA